MIDNFYKQFRVRDYMENEGRILESKSKFIDCSLGTNPFLNENIIKKYVESGNCVINEYPINSYEKLKEELIHFWKKYSNISNLNKTNISFGAGIMGILRNLSQFLINENTFVLGCSPQFPRFISEFELKKGIYEYYSLQEKNNYKFIVSDFLEKIESKYNVIYIDNPNNPTGQIISISDIEKIVIKAQKYNITVIIDEAYGDYMSLENSAIALINKYDNIAVLRSASKFFGLPNHRIGYIVSNENFIKVYDIITIPFPFSDLSCNIFINILQNYEEMKNLKDKVIQANQKVFEILNKDNYLYTSIETPIFTIKTNKYENLTKELLKQGVIAENADNFINLDSRYARIRIPKDYENLIKILKQIL